MRKTASAIVNGFQSKFKGICQIVTTKFTPLPETDGKNRIYQISTTLTIPSEIFDEYKDKGLTEEDISSTVRMVLLRDYFNPDLPACFRVESENVVLCEIEDRLDTFALNKKKRVKNRKSRIRMKSADCS